MDNKKKKILISAICIIVISIIGIIAYMGFTGKFKAEKTPEETSTELPSDSSDGRAKTSIPTSPIAVVLNTYNSDDLETAANYGFNTIIFDYSKDKEEKLSQLFSACRENEIYFGCRVTGEEEENFLIFFKDSNPDFVIFSDLEDNSEYFVSTVMGIKTKINEIDPYCPLGVEADDVSVMSDYIQAAAGAKYADFVFLSQDNHEIYEFGNALTKWSDISSELWVNFNTSEIDTLSKAQALDTINLVDSLDTNSYVLVSFSDFAAFNSSSSDGAQTLKTYIKEKESFLDDKDFELTNYTDTNITVTTPVINFKGTCSPTNELKCNGNVITTADNGDFSVDCKLKAGLNKVTFEHKGNTYEYHVTYNITVIKSVSPASGMTVPGNMEIELYATALTGSTVTVTLAGKTYTMSKTTADSDDEGDLDNEFSTYSATITTPAGTASQQNLGNFKVSAAYNGISETKTGAAIIVSKKETVRIPGATVATTTEATTEVTTEETTEVEDTTSETGTTGRGMTTAERTTRVSRTTTTTTTSTTQVQSGVQKYTYTSNYGLGTAKYVEITDDYAEVYPGNNLKVYSVPDCSPFLKGTVDYYEGSATIDSDTYYIMSSGYKVPSLISELAASGSAKTTQARVIDGYIMPSNNVKIISSATENNKTVIKISMNYKVPINAKLTGQSYSEYTSGRIVKVNNVNCTGLQLTFYNTSSISGSLSFSGSLIASANTSKASDRCSINLNFANAGKFYGYHMEYDSEGNLIITIKHKPSSISGYTIMIDPGHGGRSGGATCVVSANKWDEAAINLSIAQKIRDELQAAGATVIMTRNDDSFLTLSQRNDLVRRYNPDLFISVHCDSSSSSTPYGTTAYYYRAYSQPLAKCIHDRLVKAYNNTIYAGKGRTKVDRGTQFGAYKVARVEECPATLVEYGFISEVTECQALQSSTVRTALAKATAEGIKDYIANY